MADGGRRDEPGFDWLYGTDRKGDGGSRAGGHGGDDPDPTRRLPTVSRPVGGSQQSERRPYQSPAPSRGGGSGGGGGRSSRPPVPPPGSARPRPRRRLRPFTVVRALLVLWLVFLVAVPLIAWSRIEKVDATPDGERPGEQPGTTYLLVGSDSREGLTAAQRRQFGTGKGSGRRTDTIMLLHTGRGPNLLMSIPRDSIVEIPGQGSGKINAAFALGGADLLVRTIEQNTGIRVDDYVEIGFAGFVDVVDAVGGIEICPKQAMEDKQANLDIEKGCQEVEGTVALGFARSRKTSGLGDIARAQNQRAVVSAVGEKAASPWSLLNPVRYARLAFAGSRSLRVGEDTGMIATARFAWAMTRVSGDTGLTCGVPIRDLAVNWDEERSQRLFDLIAEDRTADVPKRLCRPSGLAGA